VASDQAGADGVTRIVEVGAKAETDRVAVAECRLVTTAEAVAHLVAGTKKGAPLETSKVAGLMGLKETPRLLPHCHPVRVTGAEIEVEPEAQAGRIRVQATVRAHDRTGVEMEALTSVAVAGLTLIDMVKAVDPRATITDVRLLAKSGGKSGDWTR
jgi:cyclic pyranopterin monophosphate synthase